MTTLTNASTWVARVGMSLNGRQIVPGEIIGQPVRASADELLKGSDHWSYRAEVPEPVACDACDARFIGEGALDKHRRAVHAPKPEPKQSVPRTLEERAREYVSDQIRQERATAQGPFRGTVYPSERAIGLVVSYLRSLELAESLRKELDERRKAAERDGDVAAAGVYGVASAAVRVHGLHLSNVNPLAGLHGRDLED